MKETGLIKWITILILVLLVFINTYLLFQVAPFLRGFWNVIEVILFPLFTGIILAYLLHPLVMFVQKRGLPRFVSILAIYLLFAGGIAWIVIQGAPLMIKQMKEFADFVPHYVTTYEGWIDQLRAKQSLLPEGIQLEMNKGITSLEKRISEGMGSIMKRVQTLLDTIFIWLIIPFVVFYLLKDYEQIQTILLRFLPRSLRKRMIRMGRDMDEALGNYIRGQLTVCAIVGGLAYLGYWLIGMPYALLLAAIVGITNIIPYFGPFIGAAPAFMIALTISPRMALYVVIVNTVIQVLEGNILSPTIVGRTLQIHPLFIIFALLVGGEVGGLLGMILAVPLFAIFKVLIQHIAWYYRHETN